MDLEYPIITMVGPVMTLAWPVSLITAVLDHWRDGRDGEVKAEVVVTSTHPDFGAHLLGPIQVNLVSSQGRTTLRKGLEEMAAELTTWGVWVEMLTTLAVQRHREGEPTVELTPEGIHFPTPWRINPLVSEGEPTLLFGPGGTSKSYLALFLAFCVETGQGLGLISAIQGRVLYLDWECGPQEASHRTHKICAGHPMLRAGRPLYRRMTQGLVDDLPLIQSLVAKHQIALVVIDSVAMAMKGRDLLDAATATSYFGALRTLPCASLGVAHMAKHTEHSSVYGSVFFTNLARHVWELKKEEHEQGEALQVGLYQFKTNGVPHAPIGLEVDHAADDSRVTLCDLDLGLSPTLAANLPLSDRVRRCLAKGARTVQGLADELSVPLKRVSEAVHRGDGKWCTKIGGAYHEAEWIGL